MAERPKRLEDVAQGWIYVCEDGSYAGQVVIQKLKSGKLRLRCQNTGGQSKHVADRMMAEVQVMIDEGRIDWSEVDVEEA